ncbi:MAG TPA: SGNH/GDSL hydrolase family protein [Dyella sp.]|uniref:SGNH/GDSL hydrolase family protein n=1 Tax=Dyella sp. TaxID=1869338 RepID=UPI002D7969AD|nr:SGNH/GDSL hydrolase family protein [Dyella sp.]HET6555324.1 SGNH/GDSL hydrolase family protein [Dyella sp.]
MPRIPRAFVLTLLLGLACQSAMAATPAASSWVGTWSASPDADGPPLSAQTVRQVVRISVGGTAVRLRLSNLMGAAPLPVGPVHVALHAQGSAIVPGSDHVVMFGGKQDTLIAGGDSVLSDAVTMDVKPLQELVVSFHVPANAGVRSTIHSAGLATAYVTERGDETAAMDLPDANTTESRFLLTDVEVSAAANGGTVVPFGDSITDGMGSDKDAQQRWPDLLAARLQADPKFRSIGVVNEGIGGNRILTEGYGPSALARFDRDALGKAGARWIVLLEGINDIGNSGPQAKPSEQVSVEQIIEGMKTLITRAHARGLKIYGATLTPFHGAWWPYYTRANEAKRQRVNEWIREGGAFDGVIDFDKAIRDPAQPDRMLGKYDSGDHLHPNGAGYEAMADAIDLKLFVVRP